MHHGMRQYCNHHIWDREGATHLRSGGLKGASLLGFLAKIVTDPSIGPLLLCNVLFCRGFTLLQIISLFFVKQFTSHVFARGPHALRDFVHEMAEAAKDAGISSSAPISVNESFGQDVKNYCGCHWRAQVTRAACESCS